LSKAWRNPEIRATFSKALSAKLRLRGDRFIDISSGLERVLKQEECCFQKSAFLPCSQRFLNSFSSPSIW
jgi:hypothetical protein